jgi:hypothetical protein
MRFLYKTFLDKTQKIAHTQIFNPQLIQHSPLLPLISLVHNASMSDNAFHPNYTGKGATLRTGYHPKVRIKKTGQLEYCCPVFILKLIY